MFVLFFINFYSVRCLAAAIATFTAFASAATLAIEFKKAAICLETNSNAI